MKYMGQSVDDIIDDQGWIGYLKRDGIASVDLVREFFVALLDVKDIEAMLWTFTVRGVTFNFHQHPSDIYGVVKADWSIPYSGVGEQARCGRHLLYFHGPERGAS
ncbi:hypothetical protein CJ030_MR4G010933 [Morella rubra]|uniref:Uncharacterized protein n=1 Tax=Morella rubra TaxID=262757 RepID=A0A6A1VSQ3_9ROSI|nr:hypothetical protein CJ030_MR4G010933 [Morella rubra]